MATPGAPNTPPNGPPPSAIQTHGPAIKFNTDNVPPSQFVYMRDGEYLRLDYFSNVNARKLQVTFRTLTPQNEIKENTVFTNASVANTFLSNSIPVPEGWLISLEAFAFNGSNSAEFNFLAVHIIRQPLFPASDFGLIWSGFVDGTMPVGFPGVPSSRIGDGPGVLRSITGTTPGVGVEITEIVPSNTRWNLLAFQATFNAGAAVANRFMGITLDDGANIFHEIHSSNALTANAGGTITFLPGVNFLSDSVGFTLLPLPSPTLLKGSFRIRTNTNSIQAADQWSAPHYLVQEWGQWTL